MARRSTQQNPENIRIQLTNLLANYRSELDGGDLRQKVIGLLPAFYLLRDLGSSLIDEPVPAARDRIIFYLRKYPRQIIPGDELMVVSGISDWPRRIRELRVEFGWSIVSGVTAKELAEAEEQGGEILQLGGRALSSMKPEEYVLMDENLDRDAAYRWNIANTIRKSNGSVKEKVLSFLRANVGKQVTGEELRYVANDKTEWARRIRELRTEEGWPVVTRSQGRSDIPIGAYILEEDRQAPAHDRKIPDSVRVAVLMRDSFACRKCGWRHVDLNPSDPRKLLELHHRIHHARGGENSEENLVTLCNVHHDEIHALKCDVGEYLVDGTGSESV